MLDKIKKLIENYQQQVIGLEKNNDFRQHSSDEFGYDHGKRNCLDNVISDLQNLIEEK